MIAEGAAVASVMTHDPSATEHLFGVLVENLHLGVLLQGPRAEILYCNGAALELLGLTRDQLLGLTSFDPSWKVVHEDGSAFPGNLHPVPQAIATRQAVRNVVMGVHRPRTRDLVWLLVDAEPELEANGEVRHVVCTFSDVSDRKRLEDTLRQSQKLEAIGRLAGGIAHDFNNLLTIMLSHAQLGLEALPHDAPARDELSVIASAASRAAELTRQLLAFARRQVVVPRVVAVDAVVRELQPLLRRLLGQGVELVVTETAGVWPVKVDVGQVEQVLMNLVANARDALPQGGTVVISVDNASLEPPRDRDGVPAGDWVRVTVSDTGVGMPEDVRQRAFEPFYTTKPNGSGTGLGLATVEGIARQNGGHVALDSAPDRGTTVRLYLPRTTEDVVAAAPRTVTPSRRGWETVLLVEDEPDVRALAQRVLGAQGYHVLAAANGPDAKEIAAGHEGEIHLLVTDVVMPGVDGIELARHVSGTHPRARVLLVSGYTNASLGEDPRLPPQVAFLAKPYTPGALAAKVREVLDDATFRRS